MEAIQFSLGKFGKRKLKNEQFKGTHICVVKPDVQHSCHGKTLYPRVSHCPFHRWISVTRTLGTISYSLRKVMTLSKDSDVNTGSFYGTKAIEKRYVIYVSACVSKRNGPRSCRYYITAGRSVLNDFHKPKSMYSYRAKIIPIKATS